MSKTVFILGAGASISHSKGNFPSYNGFFLKARNLNLIGNENSGKVLVKYENLREYILRILNKDILNINEKNTIDIERLMTYIDIEIENAYNPEPYKILRKTLLELIIELFEKLSNNIKEKRGDYNNFVENIKDHHTIITFNWDLLLDRILKNKKQYKNLTDLINSEMDLITFNRPINSNLITNNGYYLKLHGSVDWKYCAYNNCDAKNKVLISEENICGRCIRTLNKLIIPPIINKQYKIYPFIEKLWTLARIQLTVADKLVIWGYRLPPTDFYSDWLIRTNNNVKEVSIINPDCFKKIKGKKLQRNMKFLEPFLDIFLSNKKSTEVNYYEKFSDYIHNIKYNEKY